MCLTKNSVVDPVLTKAVISLCFQDLGPQIMMLRMTNLSLASHSVYI